MITFVYPHDGIYINKVVVFVIFATAVAGVIMALWPGRRGVNGKSLSVGGLILALVGTVFGVGYGFELSDAYNHRSDELPSLIAQTYGIDPPHVDISGGDVDSNWFNPSIEGVKDESTTCVVRHVDGDRLLGYVMCKPVNAGMDKLTELKRR